MKNRENINYTYIHNTYTLNKTIMKIEQVYPRALLLSKMYVPYDIYNIKAESHKFTHHWSITGSYRQSRVAKLANSSTLAVILNLCKGLVAILSMFSVLASLMQ